MLGEETWGLGKDMIHWYKTHSALKKKCNNHEAFLSCQKVCGGSGGVNSAFFKQNAATQSCDRYPELKDKSRGLFMEAAAIGCYQTVCVENKIFNPNKPATCPAMITSSYSETLFQNKSPQAYFSECCKPDADIEKCPAFWME